MYRALPEVSRICSQATRDRAYKKHLEALRNVRPSVDNHVPKIPNSVGKNFKRYEIEKQRNLEIQNQNVRLVHRLDRILREEHYTSRAPQRPYTLQGRLQKEQMLRITLENKKLIHAVQNSRPTLNRNDWLNHKLDHNYQLHKNATYKQTLPMSDIIKIEEEEMESARRRKYQNEDDLLFSYQSSMPSSARPGPYNGSYHPAEPRKPQNTAAPRPNRYQPVLPPLSDEDQHYKVHEPTEEKWDKYEEPKQEESNDLSIRDEIKEDFEKPKQEEVKEPELSLRAGIKDDFEERPKEEEKKEEETDLSLKDEIKDDFEAPKEEEKKEEEIDVSLKDEIKDDFEAPKEEEVKEQVEEPDLSLKDEIKDNFEVQEQEEEKKEEEIDLSLKDEIKDDFEAPKEEEVKEQVEEPDLSLKDEIKDNFEVQEQEEEKKEELEAPEQEEKAENNENVNDTQEEEKEGMGLSLKAHLEDALDNNDEEEHPAVLQLGGEDQKEN